MYEQIKKIIDGEAYTDSETLKKFSRDASLFEEMPKIVVSPKNVHDIQAVVNWVSQNKAQYPELSLSARGGGSDMSGGPLTESVVLDFTKHFNRVIEVSNDQATVEPGVFYRDFEKKTLEKGLLMPSFPASRELCCVGGMVANNSGGEKTLSYGKTERYVAELRMVLADGNEYIFKPLDGAQLEAKRGQQDFEGEIYRKIFDLIEKNYDAIQRARPNVSKNSSGYYLWNVWDKKKFDLTQLFVGSQGTLGLITQVKFRLIRPREYSRLVVIFLKNKDLTKLGSITTDVLGFKPETFESYDDHTLMLALKFLPGFVKRLKSNIISLGLQFLPEFKMLVFGGLPKLVLTAEFTANSDEEALFRARAAAASLKKFGLRTRITKNSAEAQKYRVIRRESFNLLRQKIKNKQTAPFIDDIIVRPEALPEFLPRLEKILNEYKGLIYTIAGHVGDGNFHIIPLMDLSDPNAKRIIAELSDKVYDLVFEYHGSMSAEHNDGIIRGPYLKKMFGEEMYEIFRETKKIFDPLNIFNPGKKVDTDQKFAVEHMKHGV